MPKLCTQEEEAGRRAHMCSRKRARRGAPRDRNSWSHIDAPTSGTVAKFAGSNTDQCRSFARKKEAAHMCTRKRARRGVINDRNSWSHIDAPTSGTVAKFAGSNTDQCRSFACKMMRKLVVARIRARASAHVVESSTPARPEQLEPRRCIDVRNGR